MKNFFRRFLSAVLLAALVLQAPLSAEAFALPQSVRPSAVCALPQSALSAGLSASSQSALFPEARPVSSAPADAAVCTSPSPGLPEEREKAVSLRRTQESRQVNTHVLREGQLVRTGSRLRYRHTNGSYAKSEWKTIGGSTYYFNKYSYAVTGLRKIGSRYYIFNSKGVLQKGWIRYKKKWYYGSTLKKGRLLTAWQKIGGKRYYLSTKTLNRLTGFQYIGGKMYYFNARGVQQTADQYVKGRRVVFNGDGSIYSIGDKIYGTYSAGKGQKVVDYALQFVGNPYKWGGSSLTHGADCSGFVMAVYAHFGVQLPHYDAWIRRCGRAVNGLANALPGDVICYDGHVAIYMGGGRIVHAADYQYGICVWNNAAYRRILTIRRFF